MDREAARNDNAKMQQLLQGNSIALDEIKAQNSGSAEQLSAILALVTSLSKEIHGGGGGGGMSREKGKTGIITVVISGPSRSGKGRLATALMQSLLEVSRIDIHHPPPPTPTRIISSTNMRRWWRLIAKPDSFPRLK